jgi:hypothetical protein
MTSKWDSSLSGDFDVSPRTTKDCDEEATSWCLGIDDDLPSSLRTRGEVEASSLLLLRDELARSHTSDKMLENDSGTPFLTVFSLWKVFQKLEEIFLGEKISDETISDSRKEQDSRLTPESPSVRARLRFVLKEVEKILHGFRAAALTKHAGLVQCVRGRFFRTRGKTGLALASVLLCLTGGVLGVLSDVLSPSRVEFSEASAVESFTDFCFETLTRYHEATASFARPVLRSLPSNFGNGLRKFDRRCGRSDKPAGEREKISFASSETTEFWELGEPLVELQSILKSQKPRAVTRRGQRLLAPSFSPFSSPSFPPAPAPADSFDLLDLVC